MRRTSLIASWSALLLVVAVAGCQFPGGAPDAGTMTVEVKASEYAFAAPDSVPSGWLTFRLDNTKAKEPHQITINQLPEGRTLEEFRGGPVRAAYDSLFTLIEREQISNLAELGTTTEDLFSAMLPSWWNGARSGITDQGIVSPGRTARKTVHLEPGIYELMCWVRAPDGRPHWVRGMIRRLVVTEDSVTGTPPEPDVELAVVGDTIQAPDTIRAGDITVRARLAENGHNTVHLVRTDGNVTSERVKRWLRLWTPDGRQAPAPTVFLGGHALYGNTAAGHTATFTAEQVEPGRYAWLVSGPAGRPATALWKPVVVVR